jgi:quercetin dioxygenase-like cupin family protein
MKARLFLLWLIVCARIAIAQSAAPVLAVVPIAKEPSHHLVFENEYVRVFKVEVAPHAETLYHKHDVDYVFVTLGDSDVESVRVGEPTVRLQLKDGETRFTKGGFAHKAVNRSDKPFVNVTVELKKGAPGLSQRLFDRCEGDVCEQGVLVSPTTNCERYSSVRGGRIVLAKGRKYLLVAAGNVTTKEANGVSKLKSGDSIWIKTEATVSVGTGSFAVCEFVN